MYFIFLLFISVIAKNITIKLPGYYLIESNDPFIKINQCTYRESIQNKGYSKMISYFRPGNFATNIKNIKPIYFPLLPTIQSEKSWILKSGVGSYNIGEISYISNYKHSVFFYYNSIGYCDPCYYNLTLTDKLKGQTFQKSFFEQDAIFEIDIIDLDPGRHTWTLIMQNNYNYANVPTAGNGFQQNRNWFGYVTEIKEKIISINNGLNKKLDLMQYVNKKFVTNTSLFLVPLLSKNKRMFVF